MRKRPEVIQQVYNDGLVQFIELKRVVDDYGTPIHASEPEVKAEMWYRDLSLTASDTYFAHADDTDLNSKIAVRGKVKVSVKWIAGISGTEYEIYRTYYNPKNNETEISLMEVPNE